MIKNLNLYFNIKKFHNPIYLTTKVLILNYNLNKKQFVLNFIHNSSLFLYYFFFFNTKVKLFSDSIKCTKTKSVMKDNLLLSYMHVKRKSDKNHIKISIGPFSSKIGLSFAQIIRDTLLSKINVFRFKSIILMKEDMFLLNSLGEDSMYFFNNLSKIIIRDFLFSKVLIQNKEIDLLEKLEKYIKKQKLKVSNHLVNLKFINGPGILRSNNIENLPEGLSIVYPNQFLATINQPINFNFKLLLDYDSADNEDLSFFKKKESSLTQKTFNSELFIYNLKPIYNPVSLVTFHLEKKLNLKNNSFQKEIDQIKTKDFIIFDIKTDGSITPLNSFIFAYFQLQLIYNKIGIRIENL